ncbi:MAG TPA: thioredoxin family protein [Bryobacteraceae bacterium]|nr:thioredoxin family protein [Bryobacteraceae bacterium]
MTIAATENSKITSSEEWLVARKALLAKEKELTRLWDEVAAQRRALPWVKVEKNYVLDTPKGKQTLAELFDGRSQLIVQHFMFGPGWKDGCVGCSFKSDHVDGALVHLEHHDVSLVSVSRAPLAEIEAFKKRMGWRFKWVSSYGSDFNFDYHVSFRPDEIAARSVYYNYGYQDFLSEEASGNSIFYKDGSGHIFHTYSTFARGDETLDTTYMYLDLTPKGRNETGPNYNLGDWVRHHDRYDAGGYVDATGRYVAAEKLASPCECGKEHA